MASQGEPGPRTRKAEHARELIGGYLVSIRLLGQQTAELHRTLAANPTDPAMAPEPFGKLYRRSMYQSLRNLTGRLCDRLTQHRNDLSESARPLADEVIRQQDAILQRFRAILDLSFVGQRIRCHGDYHLGQLLFTGKDFVRHRLRRGDRADDRRTSHQAVAAPGRGQPGPLAGLRRAERPAGRDRRPRTATGHDPARGPAALEPWAFSWYDHVSREFLSAYFQAIQPAELLPQTEVACYDLLELYLLEKALLQIDSELTDRLDWVTIPLRGAVRLLGHDPTDPALSFVTRGQRSSQRARLR